MDLGQQASIKQWRVSLERMCACPCRSVQTIGVYMSLPLWGEAGALGGTHAGGRWGPRARRRRRFFSGIFFFCAIFYLFS